jgi:hypothetical protein
MTHPYYIVAPDYRHNSSGIHVIHLLCHIINQAGGRAFLVGCKVCCPGLNTPLLTQEAYEQDRTNRLNPIALYPEVVAGNPLKANTVVRYLLNQEGVINGNNMDAEITDSFFYYRQGFAGTEKNAPVLRVPVIDLTLFRDEGQEREGDLLYINRVPHAQINLAQFPVGTQILDAQRPLSLPELAALLKKSRRLYTFEASSTCTLAALCGCPVLALSLPGYEHLAINTETVKDVGGAGIIWHDTPEAWAEGMKNIGKVAEFYRGIETEFQTQLEYFLSTTQDKASWLNFSAPQTQAKIFLDRMAAALPQALTSEQAEAWLTSYIFVAPDNHRAFAEFMRFIHDNDAAVEKIKFIIVANDDLPQELRQSCVDCALTEFYTAQPLTTPWFNFLSVEDRFILSALPTLCAELANSQTQTAVYSDIFLQAEDATSLTDGFLPEFDERLFFAHPEIYLRSWFFNAASPDERNCPVEKTLIHTVCANLTARIQFGHEKHIKHISLPMLAIAKNVQVEIEPVKALLKNYFNADIRHNALTGYSAHLQRNDDPLVSVFVAWHSDIDHFQRYIASLLKNIAYPRVETLIAISGELSAEEISFFEQLSRIDTEKIKVFYHEEKLSSENLFARLSGSASGEFIIYTEAWISPLLTNWIEQLLDCALQPAVGCVFGKIIDEQQNIVSAGALTVFNDATRQPFYGLRYDRPGYLNRLQAVQQYHRCLSDLFMLHRSVIAGLAPDTRFASRLDFFNDITRRLKQQQREILFTPFVVSLCDRNKWVMTEAKTGACGDDVNPLFAMQSDAAYNQNLSLDTAFNLNNDNFIAGQTQPKVVLFASEEMQRRLPQRLVKPFDSLMQQELIQGVILRQPCGERTIRRLNPQRVICSAFEERAFAASLAASGPEKIIDFDISAIDFLRDKSDLKTMLNRIAGKGGRLTASSQYLADSLLNKYQARYIPDYLEGSWENITSAPPAERLRIAIFTANRTPEDLSLIGDMIKDFHSSADWICVGPVPQALRCCITESYRSFEPVYYADFIASLNLHLALLPRMDNLWNRMRGRREWLELAAAGVSMLCSDIPGEAAELPFIRVKNKPQAWRNALLACLQDPVTVIENGNNKKEKVMQDYVIRSDKAHPFLFEWFN